MLELVASRGAMALNLDLDIVILWSAVGVPFHGETGALIASLINNADIHILVVNKSLLHSVNLLG